MTFRLLVHIVSGQQMCIYPILLYFTDLNVMK